MAHDHSHRHRSYGKAFGIGIGLNTLYVAVEAFYGFSVNSSALLADAGHNASDVISLILAWAATHFAQKRPVGYTYGLRKTTIMASVVNGVLIVGASVFIFWDAIHKLQNPVEVPGNVLMIVAGIGVVINAGTAFLFMKGQKEDLNIRGAFLHMAADAGVTLGVLIGGFVMKETGAYWVDPVLSFIIVAVILYSAWGLLSYSTRLALDAAPKDIDLEKVQHFLEKIEGVEEVHDLHVWAMSTTETALTAHLVVPSGSDDEFIWNVRDRLKEKFGIGHSTLQIERTFEDEEYRKHKV